MAFPHHHVGLRRHHPFVLQLDAGRKKRSPKRTVECDDLSRSLIATLGYEASPLSTPARCSSSTADKRGLPICNSRHMSRKNTRSSSTPYACLRVAPHDHTRNGGTQQLMWRHLSRAPTSCHLTHARCTTKSSVPKTRTATQCTQCQRCSYCANFAAPQHKHGSIVEDNIPHALQARHDSRSPSGGASSLNTTRTIANTDEQSTRQRERDVRRATQLPPRRGRTRNTGSVLTPWISREVTEGRGHNQREKNELVWVGSWFADGMKGGKYVGSMTTLRSFD